MACTRIVRETSVAITGASEVHRALCAPEFERIGNYEIASRVVPARHVGGDFVCTIQQGNQTYAVLGDLMGKGLSAAMWITHIVDVVHRAAEGSLNTCDLLVRLNLEILSSRVRAPLTSAVAICVDHSTNQVSCASAGHPPAVLVRGCSKVETIHEGGPIMGVFPTARYACKEMTLERGDAIVAFSDGVVEAHNGDGEDFTMERVLKTLSTGAGWSAKRKLSGLLGATESFADDAQFDDVSLLVIQRSY
jgi:phosphoserine phosphatase RsbU/P